MTSRPDDRLGPDGVEPVQEGVLTLHVALPLPSVSLLEIRPST